MTMPAPRIRAATGMKMHQATTCFHADHPFVSPNIERKSIPQKALDVLILTQDGEIT